MKKTATSLAEERLAAQALSHHPHASAEELVAWLGAVQAQDYLAARWALAARLPGAPRESDIERSLAAGTILRTHAMRGTWQLVTPADLHWLVALVGPRVLARIAPRHRELGLDASTFAKSDDALTRALEPGAHLTRAELGQALTHAGIALSGERLSHLLIHAELRGLLTSGAHRGKQPTYALAHLRAPPPKAPLARDEALARLAHRYFSSRGPAALDDFVWWSSLSAAEARAGLGAIAAQLVSETVDGRTYWRAPHAPAPTSRRVILVPPFDELLVAYRHREAVLAPEHVARVNAGGGLLAGCAVLGGRVIGTWRRVLTRTGVRLEVVLFTPAPARERLVTSAAERYAAFLGRTLDEVGFT